MAIKFLDQLDAAAYTATATATGATAINPNQNFYPSGPGSDTTTDLAVDQAGNVVRTTQEATWNLTRAQVYQILQDGNVADEIAVINGQRINDIAFAGGSANTSGIYEHDTGYSTLNRTYKPNTATTIRRVNTGALNTGITNMLIKIRYRVYDTATF